MLLYVYYNASEQLGKKIFKDVKKIKWAASAACSQQWREVERSSWPFFCRKYCSLSSWAIALSYVGLDKLVLLLLWVRISTSDCIKDDKVQCQYEGYKVYRYIYTAKYDIILHVFVLLSSPNLVIFRHRF